MLAKWPRISNKNIAAVLGAVALLLVLGFYSVRVVSAALPLTPMFIEGTVTLGSTAADTGVVVQGRVTQATALPSGGWALCSVSRASDGRFGAVSGDANVKCIETGKKHLKIPQNNPDTSDQDGGRNGDSVQLWIGRMINKGSGLVFDGRIGTTPSAITYRVGSNPATLVGGCCVISVTNAQALRIADQSFSANKLAVSGTGVVQDLNGNAVASATVYIDWGTGNSNVSTATSGVDGAFSASYTYSSAGNQTVTAGATKTNYVAASAATAVTTSAATTATPAASGGGGAAAGVPTNVGNLLDSIGDGTSSADETAATIQADLAKGSLTFVRIAAGFESSLADGKTDFSTLGLVLGALEASSSAGILETISTINAASIVETMQSANVAAIFDVMTVTKAVAVVEILDTAKAAAALELVSTTQTAAILEELTVTKGAAIVALLTTTKAVATFDALTATKGAALAEILTTEIVVTILGQMDVVKASAVIDVLSTAKGVMVMTQVVAAKAASLLELVGDVKAGAILTSVPLKSRTDIVQNMTEVSLLSKLPQVTPASLFELDATLLLKKLPNAPVEQLVVETVPTVSASLVGAVGTEISPGKNVYKLPDTGEMEWVALVSSPKPIDKVLARFGEKQTNVEIEVNNLSTAPAGASPLPLGSVISDYLSIDVKGSASGKVAQGHVTFTVDADWVEANDIHKWSVFLYRLDESANTWERIATKRIREDSEKIYYTAAIPGFSTFAIAGSETVPTNQFEVSNLNLSSNIGTVGSPVSVSAQVLNLTGALLTYTASLWIDNQVEATQSVSVGAGASQSFKFKTDLPIGSYSVRVGRNFESLTVKSATLTPVAPVKTPVAPVAVAATATPIPAVTTPTIVTTPVPVEEATAVPEAAPEMTATPVATAVPTETPVAGAESGGTPIGIIVGIVAVLLVVVAGGAFVIMRGRRG